MEFIQNVSRNADPDNPLWPVVDNLRAQNKALRAEVNIFRARDKDDYFKGLKTVVETKLRYLQLVDELNFYRGGDEVVVRRINEQYIQSSESIIMDTATSESDMFRQCNRMERFIELLELLFTFPCIKVEIHGTSLIVSSQEYLTERHFWHTGLKRIPSKGVWYYAL